MTTIEDLPDEVIEIVFSYLSLFDRNNVRLVNKHWLELADCKNLTKNDVIVLGYPIELQRCIIQRRHFNIRIENLCRYPPRSIKFWEEYGYRIKLLELFEVNLRCTMLDDIINYCPNIEHLLLSSWPFRFPAECFTSLPNCDLKLEGLRSFHLTVQTELTSADVFRLTRSLTKLERFGISIANRGWNDYYEEAVLSLIMRQSNTLKELTFRNCFFVDGEFISGISEHLCLQLTGLLISKSGLVADDFLMIMDKFRNLEKLDLSGHSCLATDCIFSSVLSLSNLKLLSFSFTGLSNKGLSAIVLLGNLQGLDVAGCSRLTTNGIISAFEQRQLPQLSDLRLNHLSCINDNVLRHILPQLPNLESLFLDYCNEIGDQGLSEIFNSCRVLKYLSLSYLSRITTLHSSVSVNELKVLKHLNLEACKDLDVETISKLKLFELDTINLRDVPVSEEGLKALVVNCPSLRRINLLYQLAGVYNLNEIANLKSLNCSIFTFKSCLNNMSFIKNIFNDAVEIEVT